MTATTAPARPRAFTVNGAPAEVVAPGGRRLLDVLRDDLGLTGTKEGCGEGECGACAVLVDGELVDSCLVPICQVEGREIRTVEGLGSLEALDPLQVVFLETGAAQCGICTPGMLMAARAFLESGAPATDESIREAIAGNLCRCTGYTKIVEAIALAAADGWSEAPASEPVAMPVSEPARPPGRLATRGPDAETARSLDEAVGLLAAGARPLAGGTDLMVMLESGAVGRDERFVDIRGLGELRGIAVVDDALELGALTTFTELRRSPVVRDVLPVLAEAAATIGAVAIQNRGTVGGNVANASPAGDTLPILLATDASLVLAGPAGRRTVAAADFFVGYRRTALARDELLVTIRIPLVAGRQVRFRKVGTRRAQAISKVVLAAAWREVDGAWRDVRLALGSVAEVPIRARRTEALLEGGRPTSALADRAAETVEAEIRPIDDVRSTADYRRTVTGRILRRLVLQSAE